MNHVELKLLSAPCGVDRGERYRMVTAGQDVVQFRPDGAASQLVILPSRAITCPTPL